MTTERKVRGDAKLEWLKAGQKKRLLVWLDEENRTYAEVVGLVRDEFGVRVGKSAVGCFWRRHVLPRRYQEGVEGAEVIGELGMELPEGRFEEAALKLARMQAWEALSQPEPEVRKAERLLGMIWMAERMALAREKLALDKQRVALREQAAAARAARAAGAESAASRKRGAKGAGHDAEDGAPKPWMTEEQLREYLKIDFGPGEYRPNDNPPLFPGSVGVGCDKPEDKPNVVALGWGTGVSDLGSGVSGLGSGGAGFEARGEDGGLGGGLQLGEEDMDLGLEGEEDEGAEEAPTPYDHMKEPWRTWFKVNGWPPSPLPGQPGLVVPGSEVREGAEGAERSEPRPEAGAGAGVDAKGEREPAGAAGYQLPATFGFKLQG